MIQSLIDIVNDDIGSIDDLSLIYNVKFYELCLILYLIMNQYIKNLKLWQFTK